MKLDLLTNATVVDDAIRFVEQGKEKLKSSSSISDDKNTKESNKPDYINYGDGERRIEKEDIKEKSAATEVMLSFPTNQVF